MDIGLITEADTKRALECLRRAEPHTGNALLEMDALQLRLDADGMSVTQESLEWMLSGLLAEIVNGALAQMRGEAPPGRAPASESAAVASQRLAADFNAGDADWEAWSCLHYRYLAPLALQVQEIAAIARPGTPHGRKHISRRIDRAVRLLADALRDAERDAQSALAAESARQRHNLPVRHSSFVGREKEMADVSRLLASAPLLTLVGPGGVGKTRLAIQAAAAQMDNFPDGVWLAELGSFNDPSLVPQVVASAANVKEQAGRPITETLERHLSSRQLLLVLDNCEHVIDACARLVAGLLARCPNLRVLATSREALGVEGEQLMQVPTLTVPAGAMPMHTHDMYEYSAAQLFVQRASAVNATFHLAGEDVQATVDLCQRLDGLPLAIELAAARTGTMPISEILDRLDSRLELLSGGRRTADPRQQTLHGTIDWSYELLTEAERTSFHRLSVFRGDWTVEAAAALFPEEKGERWSVLDLIAQLTSKSLLTSFAGDGDARYAMLETIREYASAKLEASGEAAHVRRRHQGYFLELAETAEPLLDGARQTESLASLSRERDNFGAAFDAAHLDDEAAATALRLVGSLARYWQLRGRPGEARLRFATVLDLPANAEPTVIRAKALVGAGELAYQQGDYTAATDYLQHGLTIYQAAAEDAGVASALRSLGKIADAMGDYDGARSHYEKACALYESLGDDWGVAASLNNLGLVALRQGDTDGARHGLEASLDAFRRLGDRWAIGITLSNLGDIAETNGEYDAARELFEESLAIARALDDRDGVVYALTSLGSVASQAGDVATAREHLRQSAAIVSDLDVKPLMAEWLEASAALALAEDDASRAARLYGAAGALRDDIDAPLAPKDEAARSRAHEALLTELGDARLAAATDIGRAMTWEDAFSLALEAVES